MTTVYRLVNARHADEAISGRGAQLYGGRWNPQGFPVVYASQSRALAALETFVHLTLEARELSFLLYEIILPREAKPRRFANPRPATHPPMHQTQQAGHAWLSEGKALALSVPSIIVPQESNIVLNVRHPHFARVRVSKPQAFSFDPRLWKI